MKSNVIIVAPHPDDETLGCGGTLLRHKRQGDYIHWLIVTKLSERLGYSEKNIAKRDSEIKTISERYGFTSTHQLEFLTTQLDQIPMGELVQAIGEVFQKIKPTVVYVPYRGDVHTDHACVFDAVISCTKWFRFPFVKRILAYETLSETDFGLNPDINGFRPNVFVNISDYLEMKIDIMKIYESELGGYPFPRSEQAIRALAQVRGAASGYEAAEAFMLLKERLD